MKGIKWFFFSIFLALLFIGQSSFALPFSITPVGTLPTTVDNVSDATAFYTVTNTTTQPAPASFVKFLPQNVKQIVDKSQPTFCGALFTLAPNASCILALNVSGPVNPADRNPEHHLFVCRAGGKTCAGTAFELNVTQITLVSIAVSPTSASIPKGTTQQYAATGTFSDGSTRSLLTYDVVWHSSNTGIATINASTGLATGVGVGSTFITASLGGITSPAMGATLTVTNAALTSILITPAPTASTPKGTTLQFRAIGTFTDGTTADITSLATTSWSSSDMSVATIGLHTGLATGVAASPPADTTIQATSGAITSNTSTLTVTAAVLECITVTPDPGNVAVGDMLQFTAIGSYSDGSTADITSDSSTDWISSDPLKAAIGLHTGLATGVATGTTNITAAKDGITSQPVVLTVSAVLVSIAVTPPFITPPTSVNPFVIYVGENFQYTATATFNTGPTSDITNSASWGSSNPLIASVDNIVTKGLVTGLAPGVTNIQAASGAVIGAAPLIVNDQKLYAGLINTNVCISSNGGASWGNCVIPDAGAPIVDMASADGSIYAVTSTKACYNRNNLTWVCTTPVGVPAAITALSLTYVYISDFTIIPIVCVSSDNGVNYGECNAVGVDPADGITSLAVTNTSNLYAGMLSGLVCKSSDNGGTWPSCVATGATLVRALAVDRSTGYVYAGATFAAVNGGVCVSTNAGGSYTCNSADFLADPVLSVAVASGYLYAGTTSGKVCVSTNNGSTFTCNTVPGSASVTNIVIDRYGLVFAGTVAGKVCQSYNHGATWPICQPVFSPVSQVSGLALTQP